MFDSSPLFAGHGPTADEMWSSKESIKTHRWLVARKIWNVEELQTPHASTQLRTSHHRSSWEERSRKRERQ